MTFPRATVVRVAAALILLACVAPAATIAANHPTHSSKKSPKVSESASAQKKLAKSRHSSKTAASRNRSTHTVTTAKSKRHKYYERFSSNSFALDQADGDITAGEDPVVRAAAIDALGNMNGTVVAIDPDSGRILAMVNQKMALSAGATPCSTIKVAVALAALSENVITKDTLVPLGKYYKVDLTTALAHSNNAYFEALGRKLPVTQMFEHPTIKTFATFLHGAVPETELGEEISSRVSRQRQAFSHAQQLHMARRRADSEADT